MNRLKPCLYIVIPFYNEEKVLPLTSKDFLAKINYLVEALPKNNFYEKYVK